MSIRGEQAVQTITDLIDSLCADDVKDAFERALRERAEWAYVHDNADYVQYYALANALKAIPNMGV